MALHEQIDRRILNVPTISEIEKYLTVGSKSVKIFYLHRSDQLYGNLASYEYNGSFYLNDVLRCSVYRGECEVSNYLQPDRFKISLNHVELASLGRLESSRYEIITADGAEAGFADIFYYDFLTLKWVIVYRLLAFGVNDDQVGYYTKKYLMKYIDSTVACSIDDLPFVYYFFVANSHILGITVRDETRDYFNPLIRRIDVKSSSRDDVRMRYSVRQIYSNIVDKLLLNVV